MSGNAEITGVIGTEDLSRAEKFKEEANNHFKNQDYDKAIELYTKAIDVNPTIVTYYDQDYDKAIELYTKAIDVNPTIATYYDNRSFAKIIETVIFTLKNYQDYDKAIELYTKAIDVNPSIAIYYDQDYDKAIELYTKAIDVNPSIAIYYDQDYDKAIELYTKAIDVNPTIAIYYDHDYDKAIELYTKAIEDYDKAIELYTKAIDVNPTIATYYHQDYDKAIELYTKAIDVNPTIATYYGNRSFAYLKTECFGYALRDASKAIELDRSYVKGYYRRAAAHMSLGKFKLALKDYETVTKARPNDKDAKAKYTECNKVVKKQAFEKAISVEENKKNIADTINLEAMTIEDEYTGPKLEDGKVTLQFMKDLIEWYRNQNKLHRKYAYKILLDIKAWFMAQPSLVDITIADDRKFTICGDIHGQYYDLLNVFELNGLPSETNPYLFNGDFVDRGSFSVECIFTLFGFKILYPNHFYMSRGNHESATMNQIYGFDGEVKAKYTAQMAELFTEVYNWLPLAHCLNGRVLVMHGGLFSRDDVTLQDIRDIDRNRQPPEDGLMCELLWSDPQPQPGRASSKRGVGVQFGPDVTQKFLSLNGLDYVVRSHEVKNDGYEVAHDGKCITVFSAPNYCDTMGNRGAFITLNGKDMKPNFTSYEAVPHPNVRPMAYANSLLNFMC